MRGTHLPKVDHRGLGISARAAAIALFQGCFLIASLDASALTSQTITFAALSGKSLGAAPFGISATASSGLTVGFISLATPVCTVAATTVTLRGAGTCTIQASQAGDATYAAAPTVNQSFTVAKTAQTIIFAALAGKRYGDSPFTVSATASSGLAVTFGSTTTIVCTVNGGIVTIRGGGICTLQATQAGNGGYSAAPSVTQSFAVAQANQTISFAALVNQTYGVAPFTVSATASSALSVAFVSLTLLTCTAVNGGTVTLVAPGTCTIRANQAGNASFAAATPVDRSFAVSVGAIVQYTYDTVGNIIKIERVGSPK